MLSLKVFIMKCTATFSYMVIGKNAKESVHINKTHIKQGKGAYYIVFTCIF